MGLEEQRRTRQRWNCFSKVDVLGAFDFYTYVIALDSVQPEDFSRFLDAARISVVPTNSLKLEQYQAIDKVLSLAIHEYTHFIDASSTLWGLRYMQVLDSGNSASYGNEAGFFRAKELFDFVRAIRWPDYYTEKYQDGNPTLRPWSAEITGGRVFDARGQATDRPIIFVRFGDKDGHRIVRSPVSTVSVLEASAFAQELGCRLAMSQKLDNGIRQVEQQEISRKTMDYIFHQDLTEYSVCAHLFANRQGCSDILVAYRCVAILTRWVLNMPTAAIPTILDNVGTALKESSHWNENSEWTALIRKGIENHDIGSLYYLLVMCMPSKSYASPDQLMAGLQQALERLGLEKGALKKMANAEAANIVKSLSNSAIAPIKQLAVAGLLNFQSISWESYTLPVNDLNLPKAVLSDLSLVHLFPNQKNSLDTYDVEKGYDQLVRAQLWIEKFADSCF